MRQPVKRRLKDHTDHYGWHWTKIGRLALEKSGYEIYFFAQHDGFELTVRDPDTRERKTIFEVRDTDVPTESPLYVAILEHTMMKAEEIAANETITQKI